VYEMREEEMAGIKKESFRLFYGGGELWIEHLDGIHEATDAAILKLREDYARLKRPSMPGAVAVNLEGTRVNAPLITEIARLFMSGEKRITRVAFVGVGRAEKKALKKALSKSGFVIAFREDFEKAKEWLLSGGS
jgi:hypothetical protein